MRYREIGPVAFATVLALFPVSAWGQMGAGMGPGIMLGKGRETPVASQPASPSRRASAQGAEMTEAQMPGGMGHRATPFYLEPIFLLLMQRPAPRVASLRIVGRERAGAAGKRPPPS
jgi:hypothetical protein